MKKIWISVFTTVLLCILLSLPAFAAQETLPSRFYTLNSTDSGEACVFSLPSPFNSGHGIYNLNWYGSNSNVFIIYSSSKQWIYMYNFNPGVSITSASTTTTGKLAITFSSAPAAGYFAFSASSPTELRYAQMSSLNSRTLTLAEGDYICSTDCYTQSILPFLGAISQETIDKNVMTLPANKILLAPVATTHTITVSYLYENGVQAHEPYSQIYAKGQNFSISSPKVEGFKADNPFVSGTMGDVNLSYTVKYTEANYTLSIQYIYEDGTQASEPYTATHAEGSFFTVQTPLLDGYTASINAISGQMPSQDLSYTVTYKKNAPPPSSSEDSSSSQPSGGGSQAGSEYVIWNPEIVKGDFQNITNQAGSAFNSGIWVFLIIFGIVLAVKVVRGLSK